MKAIVRASLFSFSIFLIYLNSTPCNAMPPRRGTYVAPNPENRPEKWLESLEDAKRFLGTRYHVLFLPEDLLRWSEDFVAKRRRAQSEAELLALEGDRAALVRLLALIADGVQMQVIPIPSGAAFVANGAFPILRDAIWSISLDRSDSQVALTEQELKRQGTLIARAVRRFQENPNNPEPYYTLKEKRLLLFVERVKLHLAGNLPQQLQAHPVTLLSEKCASLSKKVGDKIFPNLPKVIVAVDSPERNGESQSKQSNRVGGR